MKLFAIYIGGSTETSLIELHDARFIVAETIEDTYAELKAGWWGTPRSLHLDCWGELTSADGHNVVLKDHPQEGADKLWFVNLGGYDPTDFSELHKNVFVVAPTKSKAKVRALKYVIDWQGRHEDYTFEVEKLSCINDMAAGKGLYVHVEPAGKPVPFKFTCKYRPIGKDAA
ncbi:MAG: DUF1543 domain-containing protein [Micavibrio sp.]|nr:DUF1543 domain-containing protein [Micavibrio sp.]